MGVGNGFFGLRVVSVPRRGGRKGGSDPPPARPRVSEKQLIEFERVFTKFSRAEDVLLVHFTQNVTKHNPPPSPTEAAGGVRPSTGGAGSETRGQ